MTLCVPARHDVAGVVKRKVTSEADWLSWRKRYIGASEIGALFGVSPYTTPAKLFAIKRGEYIEKFASAIITDDEADLPPTDKGLILEAPALAVANLIKPYWRFEHNPVPGGYYFIDEEHRMASTPDSFIYGPGEPGPGTGQIKAPGEKVYRTEWVEDGVPAPPISFVVQTMIDAAFSGCSWGVLIAIVVNYGIKVKMFRINVRADFIAEARRLAKDFWRRVEQNDPYPFDFAADGALIASLYSDDDGSIIDLSNDRRMLEVLAQRESEKEIERAGSEAKNRRKILDTEIIARLGNATGATVNGVTVTAATTRRKGFSVEPTSFRTIRIKEPGAATSKRKVAVLASMPETF